MDSSVVDTLLELASDISRDGKLEASWCITMLVIDDKAESTDRGVLSRR